MKLKKLIRNVLAKKKKEKVPGGLAKGRPDSDFDAEQLAKGTEIEMKEHTRGEIDRETAKEIAKDHLAEVPNYYITDLGESRLELMEDSAKNSNKQ